MSRMPSVMKHDFSKVPGPNIQRSSFDRSRGHKTTFDAGKLIPVFLDEILPGDTVNMKAQFFARIATLLYPIMDNLFFDTFWFFVPNRIVWDNWEKFQGAQTNPGDSIDYTIPQVDGSESGSFSPVSFSLWDYFRLPLVAGYGTASLPSALPARMYNLIWNEWFRDENLQDSVPVETDDGPDLQSTYVLLNRGKRHDYFTSCLPWPQKGDAISIPLGTTAPVIGNGTSIGLKTDSATFFGMATVNGSANAEFRPDAYDVITGFPNPAGSIAGARAVGLTTDPDASGMIADLTGATAATINQLREAFATQQLLEIDARSGTRYTEILKGHFGVSPRDERLQRPEYLGGSSRRVDVRTVAQTSEAGETPQGNLSSYAALDDESGFVKSFVEHGYIMCLVNVRADITYQQGLERHWSRSTRYDFYMPSFAHLGEQAVLNKEIYLQGTANPTQDAAAFGYQERWAEYRYGVSGVSGAFRSAAAASLDAWHLALDFSALPVLDDGTFIQDNPPISRVAALGDSLAAGQAILLDSFFSTRWARPMPVRSVPGLNRL